MQHLCESFICSKGFAIKLHATSHATWQMLFWLLFVKMLFRGSSSVSFRSLKWNIRKTNLSLFTCKRNFDKNSSWSLSGDQRTQRCYSSSVNPLSTKELRLTKEGRAAVTMKNVTAKYDVKAVEIEWNEEEVTKNLFPFLWLRDNCRCSECFHSASNSRIMLISNLNVNDAPTDVEMENDSSLLIKWSDGHKSQYSSEWLREREFGEASTKRSSLYKLDRIHWGSEVIQNLPTANFNEILTNDVALLTWLQQLEVFGFVLISNAPVEHGQVRRLIDRVAFIKSTHYGYEFLVKAKSDPSNVAYSSGLLQLHTDLPYYDYKPGIQLIHCLVQYDGKGAESLIADAMYVAKLLQSQQPDMYDILTNVMVDWYDIGTDEGREFYKVLQRPVICLDSNGDIARINFSQPQRDSFFNVSLEVVPKWYEALKVFGEMLHDPKNCIQFKMAPGNIQSFDNLRVVHGRTRSHGEDLGNRELEGCYMDWDEARSKRRVLERNLSLTSEHWCQKASS